VQKAAVFLQMNFSLLCLRFSIIFVVLLIMRLKKVKGIKEDDNMKALEMKNTHCGAINHNLIEIFLEVLENNSDDFSREFVRSVRMYIKAPEFAEFFNFLLINALGGRIRIKRSVINNAIEFLIKSYEKEIEDDNMVSEKEVVKRQMKAYMFEYQNLLTAHIEAQCLFE
jgi:hypothetical protein